VSVASTPATRWGLPAVVIWAGLMLSAWVHTEKLPRGHGSSDGKVALIFLAAPLLQAVALVGLRRALRSRGGGSGTTDLLILWLVTFLFGLHAAVLAVAIGMLDSLARAIPVAVALLLVGFGPPLALLEPGSPMGIRTRATLGSPAAWRSTHRFAAVAFALAGLGALGGLALEGTAALYAALAPGLLALALAILRGALARGAADEHRGPEPRPTPQDPSPPAGSP
jgi:hypothetical protein